MKPDLDPTSQEISQIDIELIKMTGGTQSRVELNKATVDEYAEAMQNDAKFPPIDLYHDGENYWLADGFHRVRAAQRANLTTILAHVHQGSRRDAILHSVKANATHGLQRTNADKRKAVLILLEDGEWSQWSDNAIAKQCGVSQPFVSKLRTETTPTYNGYKSERKGLDGRVINTEGIGNNSKHSVLQENATGSKEYTSVTQEIAAQGKSLGLPTRGDSVLPESDVMDELTHTNSADVDDRPGAYPGGAIAASVESMLPEFEANEIDYNKPAPSDLTEVGSRADMDALIEAIGVTAVARQFAESNSELRIQIRKYYPGIDAIVKSELGEDYFELLAKTSKPTKTREEETTITPTLKQQLEHNVRELGRAGDLKALPGSQDWAIAIRLEIQASIDDAKSSAANLRDWMHLMNTHKGYLNLHNSEGFSFHSFEEFCQERKPWGLGYDIETLNRIVAEWLARPNTPSIKNELLSENARLKAEITKLEAARLEDSRKFTEFHREVQPEIVRLNRENDHLQKLVESLQAENQTLKRQLEAIAPDQSQQLTAPPAQDPTKPALSKASINLGDTVAAADPSSLAYHWKGEVVRMHESNPDLVYVRYPERLDPTKMKGIRTKQDTITCRIDSLRRIGTGNG